MLALPAWKYCIPIWVIGQWDHCVLVWRIKVVIMLNVFQ